MSARDRLNQWAEEQASCGLAMWEMAAKLGIPPSTFGRVLSGKRNASGPVAASIERATSSWHAGPIRALEWYPEASTSDEAA